MDVQGYFEELLAQIESGNPIQSTMVEMLEGLLDAAKDGEFPKPSTEE